MAQDKQVWVRLVDNCSFHPDIGLAGRKREFIGLFVRPGLVNWLSPELPSQLNRGDDIHWQLDTCLRVVEGVEYDG